MTFIQYLIFEKEALPLPEHYEVTIEDVLSDASGETEAGTIQRDIIRIGVHTISVSFSVTATWLKKLSNYRKQPKIAVQFFDSETAEQVSAEMCMENFQAKLIKDTSYGGLWTVSFTLNEL